MKQMDHVISTSISGKRKQLRIFAMLGHSPIRDIDVVKLFFFFLM